MQVAARARRGGQVFVASFSRRTEPDGPALSGSSREAPPNDPSEEEPREPGSSGGFGTLEAAGGNSRVRPGRGARLRADPGARGCPEGPARWKRIRSVPSRPASPFQRGSHPMKLKSVVFPKEPRAASGSIDTLLRRPEERR